MSVPARRGAFTLVELMIVVAIVGIVASVAVLAMRVPPASFDNGPIGQALAARRQALKQGRPVTIDVATPTGVRSVTAYPNGAIVADAEFGLDRIDVIETRQRQ